MNSQTDLLVPCSKHHLSLRRADFTSFTLSAMADFFSNKARAAAAASSLKNPATAKPVETAERAVP